MPLPTVVRSSCGPLQHGLLLYQTNKENLGTTSFIGYLPWVEMNSIAFAILSWSETRLHVPSNLKGSNCTRAEEHEGMRITGHPWVPWEVGEEQREEGVAAQGKPGSARSPGGRGLPFELFLQ